MTLIENILTKKCCWIQDVVIDLTLNSSDPNFHIPTPTLISQVLWKQALLILTLFPPWCFFFKNGPSITDLPKVLVSDDHKALFGWLVGFFQKWYEVDGYTMVQSWLFRFWDGLDASFKLKWFRYHQNTYTLVGCI